RPVQHESAHSACHHYRQNGDRWDILYVHSAPRPLLPAPAVPACGDGLDASGLHRRRDGGFKRDSTRWHVERWEDEPGWQVNIDHAPLITVPSVVTAYVGRSLTLDVTAADPEEDPVVRLTPNPPPGATSSPGPDNTTGRLKCLLP